MIGPVQSRYREAVLFKKQTNYHSPMWGPDPNPNRPTTWVLTLTDPWGGEFLEKWY